MDPIDDVFGAMRVRTALYCRIEASAPWGVAFVRGKAARFGLVVRGGCWLTVEGEEPVALAAGDCYVIVNGAQYALQDRPGSPTKYCYDALREHSSHVVHLDGGGEAATVVTGWFRYDSVSIQPLIDLMPTLIHARMDAAGAEVLQRTLHLLAVETARPHLGTTTVVSRLADILFIQAIRTHAEAEGEAARGWIGALGDHKLSRAFAAIHARVEHHWTVEELAHEAGMSRSAYAARFKERVGLSPLEYVTRWRMFRAGALLRQGRLSTAEIAVRVGYENESAFAKAFKRTTGMTPGAYRRGDREIRFSQTTFPTMPIDPKADGQAIAA
jgi:AraC-like DNA-binding protein